jgi:Ca2+-binding EF-hand superfamily protein
MIKLACGAFAIAALLAAPAYAQAPAPAAPAPEVLTRTSFDAVNRERFAEMDDNKDGAVTAAELGGMAGPEAAARIVAGLDTDKDGKVTAAELSTKMLAMFDLADANRDGILTAAEQAAAQRPRTASPPGK